jgi:protein TonB
MPASIHKIDFSAPADRSDGSARLNLVHRKVIPFAPETVPLASHRPIGTIPCYRRHEVIFAALLALGLHLLGFFLMPDNAQEELITPPTPIQVAWIAAPRPKTETTPAPPPKQQQPAIKPKPKPKPKTVKRVKAKQKAVLSTAAPATMTTASTEKAEEVPAPAVTKAPVALPAVKPAANAVQPAASASPAQTADSRPPLTLPNLNADYLNNPAPPYPEEARERGEQGKVLVRALINADGTVAQLAMKRSSGFTNLDQSALETVKKWRFVPARRGAAAVSAWVVVPISFSLEG